MGLLLSQLLDHLEHLTRVSGFYSLISIVPGTSDLGWCVMINVDEDGLIADQTRGGNAMLTEQQQVQRTLPRWNAAQSNNNQDSVPWCNPTHMLDLNIQLRQSVGAGSRDDRPLGRAVRLPDCQRGRFTIDLGSRFSGFA